MLSFSQHQAQRRLALRGLLGRLPEPRPPVSRTIAVEEFPGFTLQYLELDLNGLEPVPALLLLPHRRPARAPALLYLHAHGGTYRLGKDELLFGRRGLPAYAPALAERGIVTLACDSWCFGGRAHDVNGRQGEHDTFKLMLWRGQVLWGMMLFDELQALDFLAQHPQVDATRLGVFGMSMGATKAWWLAALDERIRLCVDLCCLTDFDALIAAHHLRGHSFYYFVPDLLNHFDAAAINELIVPRPRLSLNGRLDPLTPPLGVERIRNHLLPLYREHGRPDDCHIELQKCGHEETPAMRREVLEWLERHLVAPRV